LEICRRARLEGKYANDDAEPEIPQMQADQLGDVVIILDHQNVCGHGARPRPRTLRSDHA
jgi:hypothetical protein